jgi:hypothetical protein
MFPSGWFCGRGEVECDGPCGVYGSQWEKDDFRSHQGTFMKPYAAKLLSPLAFPLLSGIIFLWLIF